MMQSKMRRRNAATTAAMLTRSLVVSVGGAVTTIPTRIVITFFRSIVKDKRLLAELDLQLIRLVEFISVYVPNTPDDDQETINHIFAHLARG